MIYKNLVTVSDLILRNEIVKISKKMVVLLISDKTVFRYSNLLFMKQQLSFYNFLMFSQYTSIGRKIIKILVMSVMKTTDANKLFLAIFERTFDCLYICYFFVAAACL